MRIDHVGLMMPSISEADDIFVGILGLIQARAVSYPEMEIVWYSDLDGREVEVFVPHPRPEDTAPSRFRGFHAGLRSGNLEGVVERTRLRTKVKLNGPSWLPDGRKVCFLQATNGVWVEVLEASSAEVDDDR